MTKGKTKPPGAVKHSDAGALFTTLIFEIFKVYSRINSAGDRVSAEFGLSSARWRVLGAVMAAPKTVAQIARERGLTRQSVQQVATSLVGDGLAKLVKNKRHKSSRLLVPTAAGRRAIVILNQRQVAWANEIGASLTPDQLRTTIQLLKKLTEWFDTRPTTRDT
jgi:DNA-binding MarR family transcriptional regulator